MAMPSNTYPSYSAPVKEQVWQKIKVIEDEVTPLFSMASETSISGPVYEWYSQALRAAASNAAVQGDEFTNNAVTAPVRVKNHTQIFTNTIQITRTNQKAEHHGYADQLSYTKALEWRALKRDFEYAITQNVPSVAAAGGTAPKLGGLETWISTNASRGTGGAGTGYNSGTGLTTAPTDGTQRVLTEQLFLDTMKLAYDSGGKPTKIFCGSFNKMRVSQSFTGSQTRFSEDKKSVSTAISLIETDFGTATVYPDNYMRSRSMLFIDPDCFSVCMFDKKEGMLAKTGDSDRYYMLAEFTTRVVEKGCAIIADLTTS